MPFSSLFKHFKSRDKVINRLKAKDGCMTVQQLSKPYEPRQIRNTTWLQANDSCFNARPTPLLHDPHHTPKYETWPRKQKNNSSTAAAVLQSLTIPSYHDISLHPQKQLKITYLGTAWTTGRMVEIWTNEGVQLVEPTVVNGKDFVAITPASGWAAYAELGLDPKCQTSEKATLDGRNENSDVKNAGNYSWEHVERPLAVKYVDTNVKLDPDKMGGLVRVTRPWALFGAWVALKGHSKKEKEPKSTKLGTRREMGNIARVSIWKTIVVPKN